MDRKNISIITTTGKITPEIIQSPGSSTRRKRRGPAHLFKVAMFMIRRRSIKSETADVAAVSATTTTTSITATDNMLNRFVGSVRPLMHLQSGEDDGYVSFNPRPAARVVVAEEPFSPATTWSDNDDGMSSRYASASNLQELEHRHDQSESRYASAVNLRDMDENSEVNGVDCGDEMIDAKAEEFIAKFYAQIRLQRYNEMVERSIA